MFFYPKKLKSENNNPWFKPWFNILLHTQSIVGESDEIPIQKDKINSDLLLIDPKRKLRMALLIIFVLITAVTIGGWLLIAAMSTMYGTNNSYSKN